MSYFTPDYYERNDLLPDTDPALCAAEKEIIPEPDSEQEHVFVPSDDDALYCHLCGASESGHRL